MDIVETNKPDVKEKFFSLPENANPILKRIIENLKIQEDKQPFIEDFVRNEGYPIWELAKFSSNKNIGFSGRDNLDNGDTTIMIPVALVSAAYVKDILSVKIEDSISYRLFKGEDYALNGFDRSPARTNPNAEDVVRNFMRFEHELFNTEIFKIDDNRLFDSLWTDTAQRPQGFSLKFTTITAICEEYILAYDDYTPVYPIQSYWDCNLTILDASTGYYPSMPAGGGGSGDGGSTGTAPPDPNIPPGSFPPCGRGYVGIIIDPVTKYLLNPCTGEIVPPPILPDAPNQPYFSWNNLENPVDLPEEELIENGIGISDDIIPTPSQNPPRIIAHTINRGNTEDMTHGTNGNPNGIDDGSLTSLPASYLFANMSALFGNCTVFDGDLETVGDLMIQKFRNKVGGIFTNQTLNAKVSLNHVLYKFLIRVGAQIKTLLIATGGDITNVTLQPLAYRLSFNGFYNKFHGLQILINDTEYTEIQLDNYIIDANGNFKIQVTVTIHDHFGLDHHDAEAYQFWSDGFPAWWILQHMRDYVPFETIVTVHKTIVGQL